MKPFTATLLAMFAAAGALSVIGDFHQKYGHDESQQTQAKAKEELPKYLLDGFVMAEAIRQNGKDPDSFKLIEFRLNADTDCVTYSGKNSFNATIRSHAVYHNGVAIMEEYDGNKFVRAWNKYCTQPGRDWTYIAERHMRMLELAAHIR